MNTRSFHRPLTVLTALAALTSLTFLTAACETDETGEGAETSADAGATYAAAEDRLAVAEHVCTWIATCARADGRTPASLQTAEFESCLDVRVPAEDPSKAGDAFARLDAWGSCVDEVGDCEALAACLDRADCVATGEGPTTPEAGEACDPEGAPRCEGDTFVDCVDGVVARVDCKGFSPRFTCRDAVGGWETRCAVADVEPACDGVDGEFAAGCQGDVLWTCRAGGKLELDCAELGMGCVATEHSAFCARP